MPHEGNRKFWELHRQYAQALMLQGKSPKTVDSYCRSIRRLADYYDRCPVDITVDELKQYFADLVESHSWSTVKVDRNGFQHFWKQILGKDWDWVSIVKPPQSKRLPDILSIEDMQKLLNSFYTMHYRTFFLTTYSMGLRLGETLNLRVGDIDSSLMQVHIRAGKGQKDRIVPLPVVTLQALRCCWLKHRNPELLFPSMVGDAEQVQHTQRLMDRGSVNRALKAALKTAEISKPITTHSLRHSFGTHLVQMGVHLRHIQEHLGHESSKTTELYTHLTDVSHQHQRDIINHLMDKFEINQG
ncbi:MAG: tyrosine-type recombinase/integrase [Planctomycetes bacterium]|nr:tyrosine-type recombinase/integrase [Planctomycetota bacterium]